MEKTKVLYIASYWRSGTTILGNVLGEVNGFFHGGELWYAWDAGMIENRPCGCGSHFADCPVWSAVIKEAYGGSGGIDAQEMVRRRDKALRARHISFLRTLPGREQRLRPKMEPCFSKLDRLYRAVQAVTGCRVIVDSSKLPAYAYALRTMPEFDVYVLHLVRDSRAVAFSGQRNPNPLNPNFIGENPLSVAFAWTIQNLAAAQLAKPGLGRYLMLKYEDFAREPRRSVERILDMLQEAPAELPFVDDHTVRLGTNHVFSGNYSRFRVGRVALKLDEEWRTKMKWGQKAAVTAITWPLLLRYAWYS